MKKLFSKIARGEEGVTLLVVLIMMTLGSVLVIPTLNFAATSIETGEVFEEKMEALYAAEAGVEDALWKMINAIPDNFPHSYELTDINGMTVDVVIDKITTIAGVEIGDFGVHADWLIIDKSITYDEGIYTYTITITNDGDGNIKIEGILIDFPPGLDYVTGSTGGDLYNDDPMVVGDATTGITIYWQFDPYPTIPMTESRVHFFELSGPPDVSGVEGHCCVEARRQDEGTVWDTDSSPFTVTAQAKDANGTVIATIRTGFWESGTTSITCWQVNP
ncbi:MAG TPA: hypothetical protein G4O10_08405 [Dehalococcoidia bacterium]|nr:hypothetical protein [Dehalococcoidia bacterium]